ncbi:CobW family GTP-binding protein [Paenibacillus harenae]|uniref:CobW family GTP-binding protein n=1 Tax=Paenibacillus harenae TaxID=306543 RepID=UPI00040C0CB7|nr:GTP-binding protein [Paenibacillus harenae]
MSKVPVIILSGFLGSGKTTLLQRLLQEANRLQLKSAVLMNELGQSDVDGGLIHSDMPAASLEKLLDGCICCSKKSEVAVSVRRLIDQHPDVLFIELTGVANPEEVADALTEPFLLNRVELRHIITVLDSEWVLEYNSLFNTDQALKRTLRRQMEVADTVLVNKTDLVASSQLLKIEKTVKKQNATAVIHFTQHSEMVMTEVFSGLRTLVYNAPTIRNSFKVVGPIRKQETAAPTYDHQHEHNGQADAAATASFSRVQTITLPVAEHTTITVKQIEQFLQQWGEQLLRAKGYVTVYDKKNKNQLVQFAGRRINWEITDYQGPSYLVLIGIDLNRERIEEDWIHLLG